MNVHGVKNADRRRVALSPAKQALLAKRLGGVDPAAAAKTTAIPRRGSRGPAPLSFSQQRLWFLDQLEPGGSTYNIPYAYRFRGLLHPDALEYALTEIVRRHEVLRTTIALLDGEPVQSVHPAGRVLVPLHDLSGVPGSRREEEAVRRADEEAHLPFSLERGPLMRVQLLRMRPDDHILLLTFHHIVFDGWSDGVFFPELSALYESSIDGRPSQLTELPIQYSDFALWQRERLQGDLLATHLAYWKEVVDGDLPALDLPVDHRGSAAGKSGKKTGTLELGSELHHALMELGRREHATLFMTLCAAFEVLLHRYTGREDVVLGTPIAGRTHLDTEGLIGFFVNTLVLRTNLSGDPPFRELLHRFRKVALGAFEHQELPFDLLVQELHPRRRTTDTPLIEVLFVMQRAGRPLETLGGMSVKEVSPTLRAAKFNLTLSIQESERGLNACIEYRSDLFGESTVRRMLRHYRTLLSAIVERPDAQISTFRMLDDSEEGALLRFGRGPSIAYATRQTYQKAFEGAVRRTPDATAVRFNGRQLSYAELNRLANHLGHYLQSRGALPDTRIAVWLDRSLELPVALLGVLKSGAAYLPLDPSYPRERLSFMLNDAAVSMVVTLRRYLPLVPQGSTRAICLDDEEFRAGALERGDDADPVSEAGPDTLAYVIYTSGSTGTPKGVQITHRSLLNHNFAVADAFGLKPSDRVLQFVSTSFDVSVEDIFPTWLSGATLVLRPDDVAASITRFFEFVAEEKITVLKLPTAFWHEVVAQLEDRTLPATVRAVAFGGEQALREKLEIWRRNVGATVRVFNMYGPTEGTVATTMCELRAQRNGVIPIGRPLANTCVRLLDAHQRLVPRGVAGEIYIGGAGVARGYLNNPELTAEKFIQDPGDPASGKRLYRSGDMGRFLADGNIEFLGRRDAQVKVRGYRIELGEIESVLVQHPAVRHGAVATWPDQTGNSMLVAYLVLREKPPDSSAVGADCTRWLRGRLPEFMIPSVYVTLDALPLMPNGKIDRKALPPPPGGSRQSAQGYVPPRDPLESQLALVWEQVLGKGPVGVFDDFFALGGHSLLAARLFGKIERVMGRSLPLATLFQAPTIDQLASVLRAEGWRPLWSSLVPIKPGGSRPPFYCVHAAGGNVIGYSDLAVRLGPDQPVYGLQAVGLDGKDLPLDRVEEMASRYVKEIRAIQPEGPYYLGGACTGGIVAYEVAQQLHAQGQAVGLLAMFDTFAHSHIRTLTRSEINRFKWESSIERLQYHMRNLLLHPGRLDYIGRKFRTLRRRFGTRVWGLLYKWYVSKGDQVPPALRKVEQFNIVAIRNYIPRPYAGRITLFPASTRSVGEFHDREQGWGKLALGGVEIHEVTGDHLTMLQMPNVTTVAQKLAECLEQSYERHAHPD